MRIVGFIISAIITVALILVLNTPLPVGKSKTPPLGSFLSPQHGFWKNAEPIDQDFNASFQFPNLNGKVEVYFDDRLVPHIYAEHENDAYFVQGYLHAKFRLWQMEFQTHAAAGRLSEIMGEKSGETDFVKIDKYFRRIGMVYGAEKSLAALEADPITKNETDAYTAGVNAYINALKPSELPIEYKLLNYQPENWSNLKTQLFLKYMSFDLAGKDNDFEMTNARSIFSPEEIELLYPITQDSLDPIIPKGTLFEAPAIQPQQPTTFQTVSIGHTDSAIVNTIIQPHENNGSNNWAVSGTKTSSGAPILCNDPHLGLNLPSLWYEMQISTPQFNAYGVSFPGAPSIIIGFNDSCAWGVTNAGRDVKDYYEIKFRDTTMQEYLYNGEWVKTTFRNEVIRVKGGNDVVEKIALTVFGPVMYDKSYHNILKDGKYYALRWKAHDASNELLTFNRLNRCKNYVDYLNAITTFQTPGQNFVFASKTGDIAIKQQGQFPAKWRRQGDFVMPGTDSNFSWQGFIAARENPKILNPERGFVSSANQLVTDTTYPYYLAGAPEIFRGKIINRRLAEMNGITVQDMQALQTDNYNIFAEMAVPVLLKFLDESQLNADELNYLSTLKSWNLRNDIDQQGPTVFNIFWNNFQSAVFDDEFARTDLPVRRPDESTLLEAVIRDSAFKFVDVLTSPQVETINEVVLTAFKEAAQELDSVKNKRNLNWGDYKSTAVTHLLKLKQLSSLHLPIGGGANIINATSEHHGPSWRMIVQLTNTTEAYGVYPGGQSGNPGSKFYDNFVSSWAAGKYFPLLFINKNEVATNDKIKWKMTFAKA